MSNESETVQVKVLHGKIWSKNFKGSKGKLTCVRASDDNPVITVRKSALPSLRGKVEVVEAAAPKRRQVQVPKPVASEPKGDELATDTPKSDQASA